MDRQKLKHVDGALTLGVRLRAAREAAGMSQRDLAFPGCSAAYISRIERGERIPSLQLLRELGRLLGVSEEHLARGVESAPRDALLQGEAALRFGAAGTADYKMGYPLLRRVIERLKQGHRLHHSTALLEQLLALKKDVWRAYRTPRIGRPTSAPDPSVSQRGGSCGSLERKALTN